MLKCPYCYNIIEKDQTRCPHCAQFIIDDILNIDYPSVEKKKCLFCGKKILAGNSCGCEYKDRPVSNIFKRYIEIEKVLREYKKQMDIYFTPGVAYPMDCIDKTTYEIIDKIIDLAKKPLKKEKHFCKCAYPAKSLRFCRVCTLPSKAR